MAEFDLSEFLQDGTLEYPGVPPLGKTYRVPQPNARTGLEFAALGHLGLRAAVGAQLTADEFGKVKLNDDDERAFEQRVLGCTAACTDDEPCGSVYHEMLNDEVPRDWFTKIVETSFVAFAFDETVARTSLEGRGKAPVPNRADKRAAVKAGRKSAPASGATATRTQPRASTASSSRIGSKGKAPRKTA